MKDEASGSQPWLHVRVTWSFLQILIPTPQLRPIKGESLRMGPGTSVSCFIQVPQVVPLCSQGKITWIK